MSAPGTPDSPGRRLYTLNLELLAEVGDSPELAVDVLSDELIP